MDMDNKIYKQEDKTDFSRSDGLALGAAAGLLAIADELKFAYNYVVRPFRKLNAMYEKEVEKMYEKRAATQMREEKENMALDERMFSQVRQIDSTTGLQRYSI